MDATRKFLERALSSGLDLEILGPQDVLRHATAKALAENLPVELMARLLQAGLDAESMTPELVIKTLGTNEIAAHVPPALLWACVSEAGGRVLGQQGGAERASSPATSAEAPAAAAPSPGAAAKPARAPTPPPVAPTGAGAKADAPAAGAPKAPPRAPAAAAGKRSAATPPATQPGAPKMSPPPAPGAKSSPFEDVDTNVHQSSEAADWTDVPIATDYDADSDAPDHLVAQAAGEWGADGERRRSPSGKR